MSFSDDDLRALKDRLKINRYPVGFRTVEDLIARLESAEAVIYSACKNKELRSKESVDLWEIWCKKAGK